MWQTSIILAEWGHWLGLLSVFLLLRWTRSWLHGASAMLTLVGMVLLLVPLVRAYESAATLTASLHATFGIPTTISTTDAPPRPQPLVASDLLFGVSAGDVIVDEHVYDVVDGERLTLDLYRPKVGVESRPVVMVIHGGGWAGGTKREFTTLSRYLAARGYVVANIDYRLAPAWKFPTPQDDLRTAIQYVKNLETTHGVDPTRMALLGRSSGGQIALLEAYTSTDSAIRGVVSLYGPAALRWGYHNPAEKGIIDSGRVLEDYLGGPPATHGAPVRRRRTGPLRDGDGTTHPLHSTVCVTSTSRRFTPSSSVHGSSNKTSRMSYSACPGPLTDATTFSADHVGSSRHSRSSSSSASSCADPRPGPAVRTRHPEPATFRPRVVRLDTDGPRAVARAAGTYVA